LVSSRGEPGLPQAGRDTQPKNMFCAPDILSGNSSSGLPCVTFPFHDRQCVCRTLYIVIRYNFEREPIICTQDQLQIACGLPLRNSPLSEFQRECRARRRRRAAATPGASRNRRLPARTRDDSWRACRATARPASHGCRTQSSSRGERLDSSFAKSRRRAEGRSSPHAPRRKAAPKAFRLTSKRIEHRWAALDRRVAVSPHAGRLFAGTWQLSRPWRTAQALCERPAREKLSWAHGI